MWSLKISIEVAFATRSGVTGSGTAKGIRKLDTYDKKSLVVKGKTIKVRKIEPPVPSRFIVTYDARRTTREKLRVSPESRTY